MRKSNRLQRTGKINAVKMNRITEIILHSVAALAVAVVWLGVREFERGQSSPRNRTTVPETGGVAEVVFSGKEAKGGGSFRERAAGVFAARMEAAAGIKEPRQRCDAYLRLADEAFRSSAGASKAVLAALVDDPVLRSAGWKDQSLMLLMGLRFSDTKPEFKRLDALCAAEALGDLVSGPGCSWPGAPEDFWFKKQCLLVGLASSDPEGFRRFLIKNPEFLEDIRHYEPDDDSRMLNPFLDAVLEISANNPKALEKVSALASPESMSPEMQMKVAAKLAPAAADTTDLLDIFSRFYAEANPETRLWLEENAPPEAKKLIAEEKLMQQGQVPVDSARTSLGLVGQFRDQPLTDVQMGTLLTEAAKKGELTNKKPEDLGFIFSRMADPEALLRAVPQSPETRELSGSIYSFWSRYDAVGLSAALAQGQLPDPDQGIEALVQSQRSDPQAQLIWARKISDPAARQRILEPLLKRNAKALPDLVGRISREQGYPASP